ncbi:uncharacterized protein LOC100846706 [Brachypodium distachyon]|uniref:Uncharacterized protein n=1 Tax=Brachypodium distachyon TaxID=15368 RepID=I1HFX0_BRADI|nr:uncharacterized protein LOC100846706 [Brachypodium distachyon]KQK04629.1 hypothetical protein BRADI_2g14760v3 [Brachypodium distachyon]|eukprot:XP_003567805.1 uncharacterized protein LOC100846706 [Brachypodium distachyon]
MAMARKFGALLLSKQPHRLVHSEARENKLFQEKKEEMFRLLAGKDGELSKDDAGLLRHLSTQVEPKPNDLVWCTARKAEKIRGAWSLFVHTFLLTTCVSKWMGNAAPGNKLEQ